MIEFQQRIANKIKSLSESMAKHDMRSAQDLMTGAITDLGPGCFWDQIDNEHEAVGALKLLGWIQAYLEA